MYEDIYDAKQAVEHLSGFNVANRYLIVLYFNAARGKKKKSIPRNSRRSRRSTASAAPATACETRVARAAGKVSALPSLDE